MQWLTRLAAVADFGPIAERFRAAKPFGATHVDSGSMSNTHPKGPEARCSNGSRPESHCSWVTSDYPLTPGSRASGGRYGAVSARRTARGLSHGFGGRRNVKM